ncbi:MAG TPA: phage tail tape measure protein, partial [Thermoleophilia bacterium]|nr:phage tail tape measure protein [Thermoleophilia bacterium]
MATIGKLNVILSAKVQPFIVAMETSQEKLTQIQGRMRGVSASAMKMGAVFAGVGAVMVAVASGFEKTMTRAAAIAAGGAAGFDQSFSSMSKSALELAGATQFTANQVGQGMEKLAMAGFDATQTIAAMPAVLQLASSANLGLAESADIVTNIMSGFGLTADKIKRGMQDLTGEVPSSEAVIAKLGDTLKDTNNVLVSTFTSSNTSLSELGEAFKTVGPSSLLFKVSVEDTAAALGLLGNAGIKGSEAGTGLKRAFTSFAKGAPRVQKAMAALGISAADLTDPHKGIGTIIANLEGTQKAFEDAGKESAFAGLLFEAFGERAGPKMAALVAQGADAFDDLRRKIDKGKASNIAEFLETKQVAVFRGQIDLLISAMERFAITVGDEIMPRIAPFIQGLTEAFRTAGSMGAELIKMAVTWGKWIIGISLAIAASASMSATLAGLGAAMGALTAAASGVGISMTAMVAGPLLAVAAGAAAFGLALSLIDGATGTSTDTFSVLKDSLSFASEGFTEAKMTVANFTLAVIDSIASLLKLAG